MNFTSSLTEEGVLVLEQTFRGVPPRLLWKAWRNDWHLQGWWAETVKMDFRVGGRLLLGWPKDGYELRGRFVEILTEKLLSFTWHWSHDPNEFPLLTTLHFQEEDNRMSTCLRIEMRSFQALEDAEEIHSLSEGWQRFLEKLEDYVANMTLV
jgi:uncharacterized protein YndB with AHSA1/START domain